MKEEGKPVYRRHPSDIVPARISSSPTTLRIHTDMLLARIISVEADQERTCRPPAAATFFFIL